MVNEMSAKFAEDEQNDFSLYVVHKVKRDARIDGTTEALLYPLRNIHNSISI